MDPATPAPTGPTPDAGRPPPRAAPPWWRRSRTWWAVIAVEVAVALAVSFLAEGSGDPEGSATLVPGATVCHSPWCTPS